MLAHIRWRLVGWSVLVLGVILLLLGAILYASLTRSLMDELDSSLETSGRMAQVELAEAAAETDLTRVEYQGGLFFLLIDASGTVLANPQEVDVTSFPPEPVEKSSARFATIDLPTGTVRIYVPGGWIRVSDAGGWSKPGTRA